MGIVKLLDDFLRDAGVDITKPAKAGQSQMRKLEASRRDELRLALSGQVTNNHRWMIVWTVTAIAIVILDAVIAIHFSGQEKILIAIIGGGAGAFIYVLNLMKKAISSHNAGQTLLAILPNLPPEEWITVAKVMTTEVLKGLK